MLVQLWHRGLLMVQFCRQPCSTVLLHVTPTQYMLEQSRNSQATAALVVEMNEMTPILSLFVLSGLFSALSS